MQNAPKKDSVYLRKYSATSRPVPRDDEVRMAKDEEELNFLTNFEQKIMFFTLIALKQQGAKTDKLIWSGFYIS